MNITGSRQENVSAIVPENITGSGKAPDEVKKKSVYVAETGSLVFVPEDYTPAQQTAAARREEFEQINEFLSKESFWNRYVAAPTATFVKSAANQASDLSIGSLSRLEAWAENAGAEIAYDKARQQGMDYPQALLQLRKETIERNRRLADKAKFDIAEGESEVAQNLGSGAVSIGSMFLAWGLGNKKLALDLAKTFGLSSGTSMYENLTMAGAPFDTATYRGAAAGVSEYALEKIGFEWVTNRIVNERLYPITKRFIEPMAAGSVQETAQEGKDILLEQGYVESTPDENFDRLATAAIYGAILETAGANVGYELRRRGLRKNLEQAAIKDGYDTKTAAKLAKAATPSTNEMLNILRQQETQMLDGMEKFTPEQMAEYEKSIELARNLPTEDAAAEVQFYDGVKSVILKSGIDENEARRQASYWSLMVKNDYELAKENGAYQGNMAEFQRDWLNLNIANRTNVRAVKIGNRVVETSAAMTEEEINEAWQERNAERQMTAEERYREESQRGVLFSKENLTTREDGYSIADDNEVVDVVNIPDNAVPDFKTKTELRNWLIGKFEEIGNIRYLNTDTAPTIATRGLFQKAKEWVLGVYDDNRDYASNEVKDFFDALVSREGTIPNLDNIIKNKADFEESIKQALRGESATFRGMNRGELRKLRQATHTRVRRPGRTLEQELRALGYRVDAVNRTLADEKGVVDDARLAEILQEMSVLDNVDTETYEQTDALSAKMQDILANAATTYSPREAKIQQERDASIRNQAEAQRFIDELLQNNQLGIKTIEELDELLAKVVSKPDDVDIVKVNRNAIKYLQAKTAEMNKDYREAIRQIRQEEKVRRETQYQLQNRMKNFIRSLPVTGDHKASLMGNIQRVKDAESFEAVLNDVRRRATGYIEQEQKQLNRRNIEETIKSTKPTKFRKQRYTYEDNKFFAELRDILKMSRTEALRAQEEFAKQIGLDRADGDVPLGINISEYDRLKNLLYYYKINGAESSLAALQDLATSLEELKAAAADKRLDEDTLKSEVRKKDKDELLEGINKYKASNIFARGMAKIGTIRSAMSEYFGKEMADKWNLEPAFERVNIFMRSRIKPVMDSAREIYGAAKASDFLNLMQNKSQKEFELTDNDGDYDKLSIMDIADIYIGMKDPNTRANYYAAYEKFDDTMPTDRGQLRAAIETMSDEQLREHMLTNNLGTLLSYLSEQDMRFADMVQEEVGSMWELENEIFVKLYGIDLPQNRNYFPRTSKNAQDYDVMENLRVRGQTPGFFKERASTVTPRPKNIWTKYQEYVTSVGYVQNVALKYKDLHSLMTDKAIRGAIVKKYGEDSYRAFMANLDDLSIKGAVKTYNEVGRTMQKLLNNLVSGTVALNVPMAFKQLPAALNYSVNMPKTEFIKNFLYAATHPAEVKRVMDSYVGDFLKTRYEQGSQSDAIGRAMAEADSLVNSKFGLAGFSHNWRQLATTPIRFADIFAIYWGGYAKLKYNIDRGLAPEKIREDFIDETLSNQAAGNPATLAKFQREQSLRFFTAFRNVPAQYMRLITTTMTQWRRGEISDARFFSNIGNYVFVQPALYIWLGWLVKSFLYGDDGDEWFDGMMTEMALSPIAGLPIIADLASFGLDKAESALTGKSPEPWDALQVFGVDTLNKLMWKLVKDDKTGWDWAEIAASVIDVGTGAGLGTAVRTVKKLSD